MITDTELERLERLAEAATPPPWWQSSWKTKGTTPEGVELSRLLCFFPDEGEPRFWKWDTDGEFVAASREAIPSLISSVRELRARAEAAEAEIASARQEGFEAGLKAAVEVARKHTTTYSYSWGEKRDEPTVFRDKIADAILALSKEGAEE